MQQHYVITVDIKHITRPSDGRGTSAQPDRVVEDITHVVTKAENVEDAVEKAVAILNLENN